jgi:hypothetical protein
MEVLSVHNTRRANVVGFDHEAAVKRNLPIVSAITAVDLPYGISVILIVHEAIYNDTANHSLLSEFQLRGYTSLNGNDYVYKVSKLIYGDIRAAKLWYKHLQHILIHQLKFTISTMDFCLLICKVIIFIFYVEDSILIFNKAKIIDHFYCRASSL